MTPGQEAVAALYDNRDGNAVLVVIDGEGIVYVRENVPIRDARQAIDLTVERAAQEIQRREVTTQARKIQGGHWAVSLKCPDGKVRMFVEQKPRTASSRRPFSVQGRFDILMRDGFRCRYCGRCAPDVELEIDHIIAVANGGTNDPSNLAVACSDCNAGKGRKRLPEVDRLPVRLPRLMDAS